MQPWVTLALPPTFQSLGWFIRGMGLQCLTHEHWVSLSTPEGWACPYALGTRPSCLLGSLQEPWPGLATGDGGTGKSPLKAACGQRGSDRPLPPHLCFYQETPPVLAVDWQPAPRLPSPGRGSPQGTCNNRTARPSIQVQPLRQPALNSCGREAACRGRLGGGPRSPEAALWWVPSTWSAERPAWPGRGPRENQAAPTPGGHTWLLQAIPGTQGPRWDRVGRGHWASGANRSLAGVSAPRGGRGEQRPRGHPGSTPCRFYFLSLVVSLAQGSFRLWVTLGTNITSSGSPP